MHARHLVLVVIPSAAWAGGLGCACGMPAPSPLPPRADRRGGGMTLFGGAALRRGGRAGAGCLVAAAVSVDGGCGDGPVGEASFLRVWDSWVDCGPRCGCVPERQKLASHPPRGILDAELGHASALQPCSSSHTSRPQSPGQRRRGARAVHTQQLSTSVQRLRIGNPEYIGLQRARPQYASDSSSRE